MDPALLLQQELSNVTVTPAGGGSINRCHRIRSDQGSWFIKENSRTLYPGMFDAERRGLELLRSHSRFFIPGTHFTKDLGSSSFLVMDLIEPGKRQKGFMEEMGRKLAGLHRTHSGTFGLDHDNYIGSLPQKNTNELSWGPFFERHRIGFLLKLGTERKSLPEEVQHWFEPFLKKLPGIFPGEKPSLLHGDLWSGNYMTSPDGSPALIDPAVYYGHREMDIAMTRLFGGFDPGFYNAYNECFPLEKDWEERTDLCNLYPLLVHAILFGESYLWQIKQILKRI